MSDQPKIWYLAIDGKPQGPFSEDEVVDKIKSGEILFTNLVFRQGYTRWVPIAECAEFERRFDQKYGPKTAEQLAIPTEEIKNGWILLTKQQTPNGKSHYIQSGPFNTEQVRRKLEIGEVKYEDHAWKQGYEIWTMIGTIEEFDRRTYKKQSAGVKPELSKDVPDFPVTPDKQGPSQQASIPKADQTPTFQFENNQSLSGPAVEMIHKVDPEDASLIAPLDTSPSLELNTPPGMKQEEIPTLVASPNTESQEKAKKETEDKKPTEKQAKVKQKRERKDRRLAPWVAMVGISFGVIISIVGFRAWVATNPTYQDAMAQYIDKAKSIIPFNKKESTGTLVAVAPPPAPPPPAPMPENPQNVQQAPAPAPANQPKTLKIVGLKLASPQPQLAFETNLPPKTELTVEISAKPGAILKYPSYQMTRKLMITEGMLPTLDLSKDALPPGEYMVNVTGGGVNTATPIAIGVLDGQFQSRLAAFKQTIKAQKTREAKLLVRGGASMSRQHASLVKDYKKVKAMKPQEGRKKWTQIFKKWKKQQEKETMFIKKYNEADKNTYYFPELFQKLSDINNKISEAARNMDQSLKTGRKIANDASNQEAIRLLLKEFNENIKDL